jgi:methionyl-tRNA formyltransferase
MRIVFMGTAELACPSLEALAGLPAHEVVAVFTQPDRPKGRDLKPCPPPVKVTAERLNRPVHQPARIKESEAVALVRTAQPDLIVVVAYGQMLPKAVLEIPRLGCINVHASLLPRWRGAAPIQYAILHGDTVTGVTTMFINERMDAGDIILQRPEAIRPDDTAATLHDRLAAKGAGVLVETVGLIESGSAPRTVQDENRATYANKIEKEDGRIDWTKPAEQIERHFRAFNPWPSAYTFAGDVMIKLWKGQVVEGGRGRPGEVLPGFIVATGRGGLKILELQSSGGKRMSVEEFLRGHRIEPGTVLR